MLFSVPSFKYIAIGDELLNGSRFNKNALSLGKSLSQYGWRLNKIATIGDSIENIVQEIKASPEDIIITSGGLGPTNDDKTTDALCLLLNCDKVFHPPSLEKISLKLGKNKKTLKKARVQAYYPDKATATLNHFGLAPMIKFKWHDKLFFCLPGVPLEFNGMLKEKILPALLKKFQKNDFCRWGVYLHGLSESRLNVHLESVKKFTPLNFSYLPYLGGVNLIAQSAKKYKKTIDELKNFIKKHYSKEIVSLEGDNLLGWIHRYFSQNNLKLGACESCTGGLIINSLIQKSGSSSYVDVGVVTYSNEAKTDLLNVDKKLIEKNGAVSEVICRAMMLGLVKRRSLDAAISTTGVAGPSGGTKDKPVGTVYIGVYYKKKARVDKYQFDGSRSNIQERTMWSALNNLRLLIKKIDKI